MKQYTFELIVDEGDDEFWEKIDTDGSTGCDSVCDLIIDGLNSVGLFTDTNCKLTLKKFEQ